MPNLDKEQKDFIGNCFLAYQQGDGMALTRAWNYIESLIADREKQMLEFVIGLDLNYEIDKDSKLTVHFLPERIKDNLRQRAKEWSKK